MEPKSRPAPEARARDRDHGAGQDGGLGLGRTPVLRLALVAPTPHLLGLTLHAVGGHNGAALGQEEVAGEAARHLDDVPAASDAGDVVSQHDLHASAPVSAGSTTTSTTAPASASATACSTTATASASATASAGRVGGGTVARGLGRHRIERALAPVAPAAPTRALGHRALRVGQQHELTGGLDGHGQGPLVLGAVAGHPARADLAPVAHVLAQHGDVLVVHPLGLVPAERAGLLLDPASEILGARRDVVPPRWLFRAIRRAPRRIRNPGRHPARSGVVPAERRPDGRPHRLRLRRHPGCTHRGRDARSW